MTPTNQNESQGEGMSYDEVTVESLREIGGVKWSMFPDAVGAFVAEMDFGVAPPIAKALNSLNDKGLFGYLPAWLAIEMKEATRDWYATHYGWEFDVDSVAALPDVIKGLEVALEHYCPPGSKVVLPTPAYMPFFKVPGMYNMDIIEVPMIQTETSWELDYDGIDQAFADGGGIFIMCNPHNPIGKVYTTAEMERIAQIVDKHDGRVFSDEIHAPLVFSDAKHVSYASINSTAAGHTVTATSASKAWNLPGLKCAQLILSNDPDREKFVDIGFFASHGAANHGVAANASAYRDGASWLGEVMEYLEGNRTLLGELIEKHLPGAKYISPQGTYLAWIDVNDLGIEGNARDFFLDRAEVALVDGVACGKVGVGCIRYNFATPRPVMEQTFAAMEAALSRANAG